MSSGLPNPSWDHFKEMFWELGSVMSVEELPNPNRFGMNSVVFLCATASNSSVPHCGERKAGACWNSLCAECGFYNSAV